MESRLYDRYSNTATTDPSTATGDRVNAIEIGSTGYFRHYFAGETVFDQLRYRDDNQQYRFEVPTRDFQEIREFFRTTTAHRSPGTASPSWRSSGSTEATRRPAPGSAPKPRVPSRRAP
jgi:hypothetical protein